MGIKNINKSETLILRDEINYCVGRLVIVTLAQKVTVCLHHGCLDSGV